MVGHRPRDPARVGTSRRLSALPSADAVGPRSRAFRSVLQRRSASRTCLDRAPRCENEADELRALWWDVRNQAADQLDFLSAQFHGADQRGLGLAIRDARRVVTLYLHAIETV